MEYKEPLILSVKYELSGEFASKVNSEPGCKVTKVIEVLTCKMLQYWIDCPIDKHRIITSYAFMTWIKNPVFQKYYHGTKAFDLIADQYVKDQENKVQPECG